MKTIILFSLMFLPLFSIAQNKNGKNKNNDEVTRLKKIIKDNNKAYFYGYFKEIYKDNPDYLSKAQLGDEPIDRVQKRIVYLKNIAVDDTQNPNDIALAEKAIKFNETYLEFSELKENNKNIFETVYDSVTIKSYINNLSDLDIKEFPGLLKNKEDIIKELDEYQKETCTLKRSLEKFIYKENLIKDEVFRNKIKNMEKDYNFPYLKKTIKETAKNIKYYNEGLLICQDSEKVKTVQETNTETKNDIEVKSMDLEGSEENPNKTDDNQ